MIDYIVGGIILILLIFAIRKLANQKRGGGPCSGCTACNNQATCPYKDQ